MTRESFDVVIIGTGFAGASTAFFLSRDRHVRVLLVDQETRLAQHSSGRNASLICRSTTDHRQAAWAQEGADFVTTPPDDFEGVTGFRRTGSFFIGPRDSLIARQVPGSELVPVHESTARAPLFRPPVSCEALYTAHDGVVDPVAYLEGFVHSAVRHGVTLRMGERVHQLTSASGVVTGIRTGRDFVSAGLVVDAAGAWAGELARLSGLSDPGLRPTRRHILVTGPLPDLDPHAPYVWDLQRGFYFRPEQGGLLLCACDETDDEPGDCLLAPQTEHLIRDLTARCLPDLGSFQTRRLWAGHRTFASAPGFLLGPTRPRTGVIFAAGLGGHGLTTASAVGRVVAEAVLEELAART